MEGCISWDVVFLRDFFMRLYLLGGCIHWEVVFIGRLYFLGGCIYWEIVFPVRLNFWGGCIFLKKCLLGRVDASRLMPAGEWLPWLAALCHAPWATNLHTPHISALVCYSFLVSNWYMGNKFTYAHISASVCYSFLASISYIGNKFTYAHISGLVCYSFLASNC